MMSTLLTLAFFVISFIYFSESIQIVPAIAQENNQQSQGTQTKEQIVQQGIVTSTPDPLPGHEAHQSITILRLKEGNPTYQGTLTFTASKPVEVQILHRNMTQSTANTTAAATAPAVPHHLALSGVPLSQTGPSCILNSSVPFEFAMMRNLLLS